MKLFPRQQQVVKELIGNTVRIVTRSWEHLRGLVTKDNNQPDYEFYDRLPRGMVKGLELAGLLVKTVNSKVASWVMGHAPGWAVESDAGQERLDEWWRENHSDVLEAYEEAVKLGNYYLVVNPDLTLSPIPPHLVDPIVNEDDYSQVIGYRITQTFPHPTSGKTMRVIDEFTPEQRIRRVKFTASMERVEVYPNLTGLVPVIHITNNQTGDETHGRPEVEPLVKIKNKGLLYRYDEMLDAAIRGNIRQGIPIPKFEFEDIEGMERFLADFGTQETDPETGETRTTIDFSSLDGVALAGGKFAFESPGSFSQDTEKLLSILFYLFVQFCEIPEYALGVSVDSSRASATTQVDPFVRWIEKKRGQVQKWLVQLGEVVLATMALTEAGVRAEKPRVVWDELTEGDNTLKQQWVQWAWSQGLLQAKTVLMNAPIPLDVDEEMKAYEEAEQERRNEIDFQRELEEAARRVDAQADEEELEAAA